MNIKEGKFLETILAEKKQEIAQMPDENSKPIRQTYRLYDYLKKHSDQLQVIAVQSFAKSWRYQSRSRHYRPSQKL